MAPRGPDLRPPLRICHVVPSLELGGMERMVADLIEGLDRRGHVCQVFCTDAAGALFEGIRARARLCVPRRQGSFLGNLHVVRGLAAFLREHKAEIVHAHNHVAHLYAVLAAALAGRPVIVTLHGQGYYDTPRVRFMRRLLMARTSRAVAVSRDVRDRFVGFRVAPAGKFTIIGNAVRPERFAAARGAEARAAARARLGVPADAFVVGSVGRLAPEKNYPLLVRAFAELVERVEGGSEEKAQCSLRNAQGSRGANVERGMLKVGGGAEAAERSSTSNVQCPEPGGLPPPTSHLPPPTPTRRYPDTPTHLRLLLVGDGAERPKIEAAAEELGIRDRLILAGMQEDVVPWLACMDVFCLSSLTEGTSLTLLEAGAAELPLVATDVGGNREIIEEGGGRGC